MLILALDTHYEDAINKAWTGFVLFEAWEATQTINEGRDAHVGLSPYQPGQFYRRELPCVRPVVDRFVADINLVIIDGYVDLGPDKPGFGRHLYDAYDHQFDVVGVAKNRFKGNTAAEVLRGTSQKPLYVTSTTDIEIARRGVLAMCGHYRLPDLLRRVDQLARGHTAETGLS